MKFIKDIKYLLVRIKEHDIYTYKHSLNVCKLAYKISKRINLNEIETYELLVSSILHDIGKIYINSKILNKNDELTKEEWIQIKNHPILGYEIIDNLATTEDKNIKLYFSNNIKMGILFHHENEDGSGYPLGLKSKEIPKIAKIIHIIDVYDALISKRSYKNAFTKEEVILYFKEQKNILFDEEYLNIFLSII